MNSIQTEPVLDLRQLALDRTSTTVNGIGPRRKWFSRYVVPFGLLIGFAVLLATTAGRQLLPRKPVTVMPVIAKRITVQRPGAVLFQAPGWIEPRPSAIKVTALTSGILDELLVVAGQSVTKGQIIGRLNEMDIQLQVEHQRNLLAVREAELARAIAEREAATLRWEQPLHLEAALADAESELAKSRTQLAQLPYLIEATETKLRFAKQNWELKQQTHGSVPQRTIDLAHQEFLTTTSELNELQNRVSSLQTEIESLQNKQRILKKQLELRIDEQQQMKEAQAKAQTAQALLEEAKIQLKQAELKLSRTKIYAPLSGRILSIVALPGTGLGDSDIHGKSTVVEMYDPQSLQVRADVRLEDVPRLTIGQPVEVKTASVNRVIQGRLLQPTSQANVQRNTLEVKVELIDPPETVKPEMLVTATFLAPDLPADSAEEMDTQSEVLLLPTPLIQSDGDSKYVWIVDAQQLAQQQRIEVGAALEGSLMEIKSGLQITDKVIVTGADQLRPGSRVVVTGEDRNFGME
jgi:RND family efflux transporter MFP subunit